MRSTLQGRKGQWILFLLWTVCAVGGFLVAGKYDSTPGRQTWVPHRGRAHSLSIALHPNCPCSLASIRQLNHLLSGANDPIPVTALLYAHPSLPPHSPLQTLLTELQRLTALTIISDHNGSRAAQLGLHTSGHLIAYGALGEILFSGGITAGRQGSLPGPGAEVLAGILAGRPTGRPTRAARFPVFGCSLQGNGQGKEKGNGS